MSLVYKYEVKFYTQELTCIEGFKKHCRYAIEDYFTDILKQNDWKRFCDAIVYMFKYHTLEFRKFIIGVNQHNPRIIETRPYRFFQTVELDEEYKEYVCKELEDFYDKYNSEYCLETIVSAAAPVVYNASDVLKGCRKCWYFKNKTNILILAENRYDSETNQRMYDASAFLEALTNNGEC